jgi:translation initiation factor 2B subunit (eIF-2B alpha/beta/delta family)
VASERTKFISREWRGSLKHLADPKQVSSRRLKNVKIENPYFEEIPLSHCKKIITPEGFLSPSQISSAVRKTRLCRNLMQSVTSFRK